MIELILTVAGLAALLSYGLYAVGCALICIRNERKSALANAGLREHRRMMAPLMASIKDSEHNAHRPRAVVKKRE